MGFLQNASSGSSSASVSAVLSQLRVVGKQCRQDHQMLVEIMAQTVEGNNASKFICNDVGNDIIFMTNDVQKYNPDLAESLREIANKLKSAG